MTGSNANVTVSAVCLIKIHFQQNCKRTIINKTTYMEYFLITWELRISHENVALWPSRPSKCSRSHKKLSCPPLAGQCHCTSLEIFNYTFKYCTRPCSVRMSSLLFNRTHTALSLGGWHVYQWLGDEVKKETMPDKVWFSILTKIKGSPKGGTGDG